ncbi:inositol monophosphatase [Candidatus Woesearchaeota archaeon]|nr:inositol monophosphatase [Candidatus Woesearchaeota archaeon]
MTMPEFLETAKAAALKAGIILMEKFGTGVHSEKKKDNSFVSEADLAAEKIILETIKKIYPEHSFFSEEAGRSENDSEYCWYIDPLDGTHNYLHNIPFFGVSVALARNKKFIAGVIYLPFTDELFYAEKGKGAWLNDMRINVSDKSINEAVYASPASFIHQGDETIIDLMKLFRKHCPEVRMTGSCAFGLAYVACGRFDISVKASITPYDTGAGKVIVEEAGGKVTKFDGTDFDGDSWNFIASNNRFHEKLLEMLKGFKARTGEKR